MTWRSGERELRPWWPPKGQPQNKAISREGLAKRTACYEYCQPWNDQGRRNTNEQSYPILDETLLAPEEARGQQRDGFPVKYRGEERLLQRYTAGLYWVSRRIRDNMPKTEWKGKENKLKQTPEMTQGSELGPKLRHWEGPPEVNRTRVKIPPHDKIKQASFNK